MTEKEFNLSEKIEDNVQRGNFISSMVHVQDIKEFIKRLKEEMPNVLTTTRGELITLHEIIDILAGDKLI